MRTQHDLSNRKTQSLQIKTLICISEKMTHYQDFILVQVIFFKQAKFVFNIVVLT